ncbi:MAG: LysE family transporter [Proteobacteria bacterium]|nr:LysE family transporter [Pseudomonadota bacterium]
MRPRHTGDMDGVPGFLLAALALAGSPGPATLSLAAASAAFGARRVAGYFIGILVGMVGVMAIVASGVIGLMATIPGVTPIVTIAAALYFVWLAWRIATAPPLTDVAEDCRSPTFAGGLALSLVNPKGYAAMAALFSGFVLMQGQLALDAVLKVALLTVLIAVVNVVWLSVGAALTRLFRAPRTNRIVNVIFAILLLVSVALAVR